MVIHCLFFAIWTTTVTFLSTEVIIFQSRSRGKPTLERQEGEDDENKVHIT